MVVGGVADAVMVLLVVALLLKLFLVLIPSMVVGLLVWVLPIGAAAAGVDARAVVLISVVRVPVLVALLVMLLKPWVLLLVMFLFGRDGVGGGVTVDVLNAVVDDGVDGDVAVGVEMPVIALPV